MDEYPVVGKLCSWPTLVGGAVGALLVMFVVYPPHVGWGDGMKWGDVATWVGAFTSGGAAIAAWYAARLALKLARLPLDQQESFRRAKARAISAAVATELVAAQEIMAWGKGNLGDYTSQDELENAKFGIRALKIDKTAMTERFMADFDVFGDRDAIVLMSAASELLNFNAAMLGVERGLDSALRSAMLGPSHVASCMEDAIKTCTLGYDIVSRALSIAEEHLKMAA